MGWRTALVTVLLLLAGPVVSQGTASEPAYGWSWSSAVVDGPLAVRLALFFPDQVACTLTFVAWYDVLDDAHEVLVGRDDEVHNVFMADQSREGLSWTSDLPGTTDVIWMWADGRHGLAVTNVAAHGPYENWIFSAQGLRGTGHAEPAVEIRITCDGAFVVERTEAAREVVSFHPEGTCPTTWNMVCGVDAALHEEGTWAFSGPNTILRFHHTTQVADAGRIELHGPAGAKSTVFALSPLDEPVSLRIAGGAGVYGYRMTLLSAISLTAGYGWSFHPVASLDEWAVLPTL